MNSALAQRFFNRPLVLELDRAETLFAALKPAVAINGHVVSEVTEGRRPYDVVHGVAIISIGGVLVHGPTFWWDETDYSSILNQMTLALGDGEVRAIALQVDSPGGEVDGCFDLADKMFEMRGTKPIWAILDSQAFSAAYALASAADRIIVPRTGGTGSIGVVCLHVDMSKMLDDFGIRVTAIQYGEFKTETAPFVPLSKDAKKRLQADIDNIGELFVATVARNRSLDPNAIRAMEARTFLGEGGVANGLADDVAAPGDAFRDLINLVN